MTHTTTLFNPTQGHQTLDRLWQWLKPRLVAGHRFELSIAEERRNLEQNALLHALLADIARQVVWAGKKRDAETWKRLTTAAWLRARGESVEVLPAIDGHGIDVVFRRTSKLTKAEMSELIEFVTAWASEHAVEPSER